MLTREDIYGMKKLFLQRSRQINVMRSIFQESLAEKYGVRGIPYLVIIDQHGNIVDKEGRGTVETASGTQLPEKWKTV